MSTEELDAFRSELLRQKIIFEAELRRQRESFEERLSTVALELAAREADCRNLQSVVTILGKKVDALTEQVARRPPTPRRMPTPTRPPSLIGDDEFIKPPQNLGANSARRLLNSGAPSPSNHTNSNTFLRRPSPLISAASPSTITVMHRVSSLSALSRTDSPARSIGTNNGTAPTAAKEEQPPHTIHAPTTTAADVSVHADPQPNGPVPISTRRTLTAVTGGNGGGHPHRPLSRRAAGVDGARDGHSVYAGSAQTPTSSGTASPRVLRGRRRSNSLKGKQRRGSSAHRLADVKATDDW